MRELSHTLFSAALAVMAAPALIILGAAVVSLWADPRNRLRLVLLLAWFATIAGLMLASTLVGSP